MSEPYLAEIRLVSFNFAPKGWALCNGQLLAINQNQALFSLLGTTYGGNGQTTFALPNLQGRIPFSRGLNMTLGQTGGELAHTLLLSEMPAHAHALGCKNAAGTLESPASALPAIEGRDLAPIYGTGAADAQMKAEAVATVGGSQPHNNMPPYLALNFVIALQGVYPSQT